MSSRSGPCTSAQHGTAAVSAAPSTQRNTSSASIDALSRDCRGTEAVNPQSEELGSAQHVPAPRLASELDRLPLSSAPVSLDSRRSLSVADQPCSQADTAAAPPPTDQHPRTSQDPQPLAAAASSAQSPELLAAAPSAEHHTPAAAAPSPADQHLDTQGCPDQQPPAKFNPWMLAAQYSSARTTQACPAVGQPAVVRERLAKRARGPSLPSRRPSFRLPVPALPPAFIQTGAATDTQQQCTPSIGQQETALVPAAPDTLTASTQPAPAAWAPMPTESALTSLQSVLSDCIEASFCRYNAAAAAGRCTLLAWPSAELVYVPETVGGMGCCNRLVLHHSSLLSHFEHWVMPMGQWSATQAPVSSQCLRLSAK